jgi:hypothetical protein
MGRERVPSAAHFTLSVAIDVACGPDRWGGYASPTHFAFSVTAPPPPLESGLGRLAATIDGASTHTDFRNRSMGRRAVEWRLLVSAASIQD